MSKGNRIVRNTAMLYLMNIAKLVLPLLTFLYALLMACSAVAYNGGFPWGAVLASLTLGNIPTVVLLAIYFSCRERRKRRDDVEKMNIQDL